MSEKISQRILIGELVIIVLPSLLILLTNTISQISLTISPFPWNLWEWYSFANTLLALLACIALASGCFIAEKFVHQGKQALDSIRAKWWFLSFLGVLLIIISIIIFFLPPPPEYSAQELFQDHLVLYMFASPIFIPFIHLVLERFLRKGINIHE